MDPDPGGPKTCGSGSRSPTLVFPLLFKSTLTLSTCIYQVLILCALPYLTIDLPALARGNVNLREDGAQVEVHQRRRRTRLTVVDAVAVAAAPPTPRLAG